MIEPRSGALFITGSRATEFIIAVFTLPHEGATTATSHTDEQVTLRLVGLREHHTIGLGERLQQISTRQVGITEVLDCSAMHKTSGVDVTSKKSGKRLAYLQNSGKLVVWLHNECFIVFCTLIILQINDLCNHNPKFSFYFFIPTRPTHKII